MAKDEGEPFATDYFIAAYLGKTLDVPIMKETYQIAHSPALAIPLESLSVLPAQRRVGGLPQG